ncbi:hypothetical protein V6O07_15270, partial [Arthrospira platensis SPKY2]
VPGYQQAQAGTITAHSRAIPRRLRQQGNRAPHPPPLVEQQRAEEEGQQPVGNIHGSVNWMLVQKGRLFPTGIVPDQPRAVTVAQGTAERGCGCVLERDGLLRAGSNRKGGLQDQ